MANKDSNFGSAISLREYLNSQLVTDTPKSIFMKIININNYDAGPFDSSNEEPALFSIGDIIYDAQLVWVGDQFYIQGRKIEGTGSSEEYSPMYFFPFNAIAVEFVEKVNNNTLYLDLNLPEGVSATLSETYKSGLVNGGEPYELPNNTKITIVTANDWSFYGWNTQANGEGTDISDSYSFPNKITGTTLYAKWTADQQS